MGVIVARAVGVSTGVARDHTTPKGVSLSFPSHIRCKLDLKVTRGNCETHRQGAPVLSRVRRQTQGREPEVPLDLTVSRANPCPAPALTPAHTALTPARKWIRPVASIPTPEAVMLVSLCAIHMRDSYQRPWSPGLIPDHAACWRCSNEAGTVLPMLLAAATASRGTTRHKPTVDAAGCCMPGLRDINGR